MKNITKITLSFLIIFLTIFFISCGSNEQTTVTETEAFTVTFVDYNGDILKTINCDSQETCDIEPPINPNNKENSKFLRWSVFESEFSEIDEDTEIEAIYNYDNRLFTVFGRAINMYSFFIMLGILVALLLSLREAPRIGMKKDDFIDGFLWIVPVSILGARLWYVVAEWDVFYDGSIGGFIQNFLGFQNGSFTGFAGLAIHGAFFTAVIMIILYSRKRKIDIFKILDIVAVGFIIAQAFGRWGNFFNQEAHGGLVGGMTEDGNAILTIEQQFNYLRNTIHIPEFIVNNMFIIDEDKFAPIRGFYHPTFFYESIFNLLGFSIMLILRRIKKIHFGEIFAFYLIWYGGLRIFIETMRTDPLTFEFLGQTFKLAIVTSILMIIGGILVSIYVRTKRKNKTYAESKYTIDFKS
ncbi:MAG: prolipoprotein diacylglyceryl transferase [Candidatus Izimaplasma sp.]|nr:prolipoprotein diacylglyceryl transferase [Candidatus Izimaplasma bacterium]